MKAYSKNSSVRSILRSPIGKDVVTQALNALGKPMLLIDNPLMSLVKLKALPKLSRGAVNVSDIEQLSEMLNRGAAEVYIPDRDYRETPKWWKEAVFYQIYPRSFKDSNGDGTGDLCGVIEKLDYLYNLGVGCIWLSPVYASPNDDNGYDISDYYSIMPEFGTMADFDRLLAETHARGMRLIMDLVVNHTSDEHEWFQRALGGERKYMDYYIHRQNTGGTPPNNWQSLFGGSAWNYYPDTDTSYLHLFSRKQIDLNWENPELRTEIYKMVNFWLDKGVDGFRLDVISFISKTPELPDGMKLAQQFGFTGVEHYFSGPRLHEYLREMNKNCFDGRDIFTVGETPVLGLETIKLTTAENRRELNTAFCFDHLDCPGKFKWDDYRYDTSHLKKIFMRNQRELDGGVWNTLFYDNHDNPRMISKIDPEGKYRVELAKALAVIQFTLKGTPFVYQGQEIGMVNADFADISEFRDVESLNLYKQKIAEGLSENEVLNILRAGSRDHARTPVQWTQNSSGFSSGTPWIKMNGDLTACNVARQLETPGSVFESFRELIALRKAHHALIYGKFTPRRCRKELFCYTRSAGSEGFLIEVNLTDKSVKKPKHRAAIVYSNYSEPTSVLRPYEANIYKL